MSEVFAIAVDTLKADDAGPEAPDLIPEDRRPAAVVGGSKILRRRGRALHDVGESDAEFQDAGVVFRPQGLDEQAGPVGGVPEAVAGPGVVVASSNGIRAGIDADDQDVESRCEVVGQRGHRFRTFAG